jgi:hypothetical protein
MTDFWRIVASLGVPGLALGIFYMLFKGASRQWPITRKWTPLFLALWMLLGVGIVFFALERYAPERQTGPEVYQIRVLVLSSTGQPVDDARVWSARGGEAKKVDGGWEFELPAVKRPADGQLPLFATQGERQGAATIPLGAESYVSGTIRLSPPAAVEVRGIVQDEASRGVGGVKVMLEETGAETVTAANGTFQLPSRPAGEPVTLRAEKEAYTPRRQVFKAQGELLYLQLGKAES